MKLRSEFYMRIKRGDIWLVDFGPPRDAYDHLQHSIRPVVIVSNNKANEHSTVLQGVPLTSNTGKKRYLPTHVFINGFQAEGLYRHSMALCEQLCSIRCSDMIHKVGRISTYQLARIAQGVQIQLGMEGAYDRR
jgi:mRNA-degrading endonuclease toxin of MazEF toxin-antitoxin module